MSLAGNTIFSGTNDFIFSGATALAAARTLTVVNATTFSGVISGAGGLTKTGAGTLTLSGTAANTFSGGLTINAGTLVLNKTAGVNTMGGTTLTIGDSAGGPGSTVVQLNASNQIPDATAVFINTDGLLGMQGFTDAIGTLTMYGGSVTGTGASRLDLGGDVVVSAIGTNVALITANVGLTATRIFTVNDNAVPNDTDLAISGVISTGFALTKAGAGLSR